MQFLSFSRRRDLALLAATLGAAALPPPVRAPVRFQLDWR